MMSRHLPCKFSIIRYLPDVVKGEFINIGIVVQTAEIATNDTQVVPLVQFTRDWSRVLCLDPAADIMLLESLEQEIGLRLRTDPQTSGQVGFVTFMQETLSNSIQLSAPRATLAENLSAELEQLMQLYVETRKPAKPRDLRKDRRQLTRVIRSEFIRGGIWKHMEERIPAALYTQPGDPFTIDCGYGVQVNHATRIRRMFHAIPLQGDMSAAQVLALEAPLLRDGVNRKEGAVLQLIAVVQPVEDELQTARPIALKRYQFGIESMRRQDIEVITLDELPACVQRAQQELRLTLFN